MHHSFIDSEQKILTYRILLIEDNLSYIAVLKQMFLNITSFKCQLQTTNTLKAGCEELKKNKFDIVLLDLELPDSQGKDTFDNIIKFAGHVPIVLVSALEDVNLAITLIREGACDYLLKKELNYSLLEKTIHYIVERKLTEKLLEDSEKKYRDIVEASLDGIVYLNTEAIITFCNQTLANALGYSEEEIIGKKMDQFYRDDTFKDLTALREINENKNTSIVERCLVKKNGKPFCAMIKATTIMSPEGQPEGSFALVSDITLQQETDKKLIESVVKYQSLVEHSPDAILIFIEGKIVFVNLQCLTLLAAKKKSDLLGKHVLSFIPPEAMANATERLNKLNSGEMVSNTSEQILIQLDGNRIEVEAESMLIKFEDKPAVQLIVRDISDRKKATLALLESESRYKILTESSPEPILVNCHGKIVYANLAATQMFAVGSAEELLGQTTLDLVHPDSLTAVKLRMEQIYNHQTELGTKECMLKSFNGSVIITEAQGVLISYYGERAIVMTLRDITSRKKAEVALEEKLLELQRVQKLTYGRELKMIELKKEVNELLEKQNLTKKYRIVS